jgi:YgiT-type zinc finger domain-containing protein
VIIMCMFCRNSITVESTTTHVVNVQNYTIIVKNVPCLECEQCGKKYYTDEVAEQLENIINMPELLIQELAILDYSQALENQELSNK